ncbi:MAG: hypothetical protein ACJ79S_00800 [Gemmatimonadaceae bacterium]
MNARFRVWASAAMLAVAAPLAAHAQDLASTAPDAPLAAAPSAAPVAAPAAAAEPQAPTGGPTLAAASVAVRAVADDRPALSARSEASAAAPLNALPAARSTRTQSKALMIVGGAAFVAGAIIGDDAGTIIMIAGAGVGLYGLYQYLQ